MKSIGNMVLVRAEKGKRFKRESGIVIDQRFNPLETKFVTQDGIVEDAPQGSGLVKGDTVYCHHFLTNDDNRVEGDLYRIRKDDIYCKVEGDKLTMIGEWNFCEPIIEDGDYEVFTDKESRQKMSRSASGVIMNVNVQHDSKRARVVVLSDAAKDLGIEDKDIVMYRKDCDYEMEVEGKTYFRIRTKDIEAVYGRK